MFSIFKNYNFSYFDRTTITKWTKLQTDQIVQTIRDQMLKIKNPNNLARKADQDHHAQQKDPASVAYKEKHANRSAQLDLKQQK